MTSSLVGSEMCIRDSTTTCTIPIPAKLVAGKGGGAIDWSSFWLFQPPIAVSYTHLTLPTICSV
eukprot:7610785-Prorocentrum_lima.AAC.1